MNRRFLTYDTDNKPEGITDDGLFTGGGSGGGADWNTLLNKPFGEKDDSYWSETLIDNEKFTLTDGETSIVLSDSINLESDFVYELIINDETFILECKFESIQGEYIGSGMYEQFDINYIGNKNKYEDDSINDFILYSLDSLIFKPKDTTITLYSVTLNKVHVTKIGVAFLAPFERTYSEDYEKEVYKLKEEYIPNNVARHDEIPKSQILYISLRVYNADVTLPYFSIGGIELEGECTIEKIDNTTKYTILTESTHTILDYLNNNNFSIDFFIMVNDAVNGTCMYYRGARAECVDYDKATIEFANNVVVEIKESTES